jgi:hypothetical protein
VAQPFIELGRFDDAMLLMNACRVDNRGIRTANNDGAVCIWRKLCHAVNHQSRNVHAAAAPVTTAILLFNKCILIFFVWGALMVPCYSGRSPFGAEDEDQYHTMVVRAVAEFVKGAVLHDEGTLVGRDAMAHATRFERVELHVRRNLICPSTNYDGFAPMRYTTVSLIDLNCWPRRGAELRVRPNKDPPAPTLNSIARGFLRSAL